MIQGGSVIIADIEDVWGNVTNIGLGEHAVRTKAPPMFYDKRGNVLRYLDFESPTYDYRIVTTGGATALRSTDISLTGDFSLKMYCPNTVDQARIFIKTHDFHEQIASSQMVYSTSANYGEITFDLNYDNGTISEEFKLEYLYGTGDIYIYTDSHTSPYYIGTINPYFDPDTISTLKLSGNFSTSKYIYLQIFGSTFDLRSYKSYSGPSIAPKQFYSSVNFRSCLFSSTMYIDNVIVTENE